MSSAAATAARMVLELGTRVWRGPAARLGGAWAQIYHGAMPEPLATVRFYPGGRIVISRPGKVGENAEIRKLPGSLGEGPTALEILVRNTKTSATETFAEVLGDFFTPKKR